jgi:hypothetical protein
MCNKEEDIKNKIIKSHIADQINKKPESLMMSNTDKFREKKELIDFQDKENGIHPRNAWLCSLRKSSTIKRAHSSYSSIAIGSNSLLYATINNNKRASFPLVHIRKPLSIDTLQDPAEKKTQTNGFFSTTRSQLSNAFSSKSIYSSDSAEQFNQLSVYS